MLHHVYTIGGRADGQHQGEAGEIFCAHVFRDNAPCSAEQCLAASVSHCNTLGMFLCGRLANSEQCMVFANERPRSDSEHKSVSQSQGNIARDQRLDMNPTHAHDLLFV